MDPVIVPIIIVIVVWLAIALPIAAVMLRAAVWFCNKLGGGQRSPNAIPEPTFGKALGIVFVSCLVNAVIGVLLGLAIAVVGTAQEIKLDDIKFLARVVGIPVNLLVMAGVSWLMLPTSFGRALAVTVLQLIVTALAVGPLLLAAFAIYARFHRWLP